jgi:para-nitrobenzyl esterase
MVTAWIPERWWLVLAVGAALASGAGLSALTRAAPASASPGIAPAVAGALAAAQPACSPGTDVQTADGPVCGLAGSGVTSYLGIPYAAPPVGKLRFAPPQPALPWTTTFAATVQGNQCPEPGGPYDEDCLDLNVRVPSSPSPGPRAVMVEIHGGGFSFLSSPDNSYLASAGNVIVVEVSYRLGILGFLAEKALGAHSGDYALQDEQAALQWVQRNVGAFGGDAGNVTIFGQSAGGSSVCDNSVSPTARGLFQKGISESGYYNSLLGANTSWQPQDCKVNLPTEAQAQAAGASFAATVGCGDASDVAACLRALPAQTLLDKADDGLSPGEGTIGPVVNGTTLPMSPARAFAQGQINPVKLMIGVSRDEVQLDVAKTPEEYRTMIRQQYGALASAVMALYPLSRFPDSSPFIAYRTIIATPTPSARCSSTTSGWAVTSRSTRGRSTTRTPRRRWSSTRRNPTAPSTSPRTASCSPSAATRRRPRTTPTRPRSSRSSWPSGRGLPAPARPPSPERRGGRATRRAARS